MPTKPVVYHIPICPFCQRLEVLLAAKGLSDAVDFRVVDITVPRDPHILSLTGGTTALPVMELEDGRPLKESLVLLEYLEDRFPEPAVRRADPYERAIENLLVSMEGRLVGAGYHLVMNQDRSRRDGLVAAYLDTLAELDAFLVRHGVGDGPWLFDRFGWAEVVYAPFFQRFAFIDYYEGVGIPDEPRFSRVRAWWEGCVTHPTAQQTSDEEVIKLYYDYARGCGNGALPAGRRVSSFVFEPHWRNRPWPPQDKYEQGASDAALALLQEGP
jgi:glutathione S-transferase